MLNSSRSCHNRNTFKLFQNKYINIKIVQDIQYHQWLKNTKIHFLNFITQSNCMLLYCASAAGQRVCLAWPGDPLLAGGFPARTAPACGLALGQSCSLLCLCQSPQRPERTKLVTIQLS